MAVRWAVTAALASAVRRGSGGGGGSDWDGEGGADIVFHMVCSMIVEVAVPSNGGSSRSGKATRILPSATIRQPSSSESIGVFTNDLKRSKTRLKVGVLNLLFILRLVFSDNGANVASSTVCSNGDESFPLPYY